VAGYVGIGKWLGTLAQGRGICHPEGNQYMVEVEAEVWWMAGNVPPPGGGGGGAGGEAACVPALIVMLNVPGSQGLHVVSV